MELRATADDRLQLFRLWKTVFGDDDAYIRLFFDGAFQSSRCFAKKVDGRIVSALYLLDCGVKVNGEMLPGYYLYAAATEEESRGRGYMGALVEEAKRVSDEEKRLLLLVPASESLYAYYARFGFQTAMYLFEGEAAVNPMGTPCSADDYFAFRTKLDNAFHWTRGNFDYALACLAYDGAFPYRTETGTVLWDGETAAELLCDASSAEPRFRVRTPYPLPGTEKKPFGMIYTADARLSEQVCSRGIYMNLALD